MGVYQDTMVLSAANSYNRKYYLNENFATLPDGVKDELKIMCALFVEEVGGILTLIFDEDGSLLFEVTSNEDDFFYDEIGSALKIKELQREKRELLEGLEAYYRTFVLGEELDGGTNEHSSTTDR